MKRTTFLLAALAAGSLALADPPARTQHFGGPPIERLTQDLGLNETQQAEVRRIFEAQRAKMEAERSQHLASSQRPTREQMHARHEQMEAELRQQLGSVLTAEQLAKFEELRKRRPAGPPPEGAGPGMAQPQSN